jgi:hypothetical protein
MRSLKIGIFGLCGSLLIASVESQAATVSVWGTNYTYTVKSTTSADAQYVAALGATSYDTEKYDFGNTVWANVASKIESNVANVNGSILEVYLFTTESSPSGVLSTTNVLGAVYVVENMGTYVLRVFHKSGSAYAEDTVFSNELSGNISCLDFVGLAQVFSGDTVPANSSVYRLAWNSTSKFDNLPEGIDTDLRAAMLDVHPGAVLGSQSYFTGNDITDEGPGGGDFQDDAGTCKAAAGGCTEEDMTRPICNQFGGAVCVATTGGGGGDCAVMAMDSVPNNGLSIDFGSLRLFRDAAMTHASLKEYIATYYLYGTYVSVGSSEIAAFPNAQAAVLRILNGTSTQVIIDATLYAQASDLITGAYGLNDYLDNGLDNMQDALDWSLLVQRSTFCTHWTGSSTCGF